MLSLVYSIPHKTYTKPAPVTPTMTHSSMLL